MDKENQQKLQQKYMEMQMLGQQIQQMQKQLELIANQVQELNATKEALDDIGKTPPGTNTFVPVASGIFVKGKITDNKEVLVNVGAGTAVKKTIPQTEELIKGQLTELTNFKKELEENLKKLISKAKTFEKELSQLAK